MTREGGARIVHAAMGVGLSVVQGIAETSRTIGAHCSGWSWHIVLQESLVGLMAVAARNPFLAVKPLIAGDLNC